MKAKLNKPLNARTYDGIQLFLLLAAFGSAFLVGSEPVMTAIGMVIGGLSAATSFGVMRYRRLAQHAALAPDGCDDAVAKEVIAPANAFQVNAPALTSIDLSKLQRALQLRESRDIYDAALLNSFESQLTWSKRGLFDHDKAYVPNVDGDYIVSVRDVLLSIRVARTKLLVSEWGINFPSSIEQIAMEQGTRPAEISIQRARWRESLN